jgi:hypothetical protein
MKRTKRESEIPNHFTPKKPREPQLEDGYDSDVAFLSGLDYSMKLSDIHK